MEGKKTASSEMRPDPDFKEFLVKVRQEIHRDQEDHPESWDSTPKFADDIIVGPVGPGGCNH